MIAGMVALVVGLIFKSKSGRVAAPLNGFTLNAKLPDGSSVKSTQLVGDRLSVRIITKDGEQIIIFNVKKGREIGRINLK